MASIRALVGASGPSRAVLVVYIVPPPALAVPPDVSDVGVALHALPPDVLELLADYLATSSTSAVVFFFGLASMLTSDTSDGGSSMGVSVAAADSTFMTDCSCCPA